MRDVSHRAAATMTLGLITDDLFGALMEAPIAPASDDRLSAFAAYAAATLFVAETDSQPAARTGRSFTAH